MAGFLYTQACIWKSAADAACGHADEREKDLHPVRLMVRRKGVLIKMKITIERFGPIDRFEYNLDKDLIVTYGNNNIGKSYAMQVVYLLLKTFTDMNTVIEAYFWGYIPSEKTGVSAPKEKTKSMVLNFLKSNRQTQDITEYITKEVNNLICSVFMPKFINSCRNTFGNFEKTLEKFPQITIDYEEYHFLIDLKTENIDGVIKTKPIRLKKVLSGIPGMEESDTSLDINIENDDEEPTDLIFDKIHEIFGRYIRLISNNFGNVYFLPASRSGIYAGMNAFGSIVAELSKNRAFITKKIEFPGISEPISDYFISLSNIRRQENEKLKTFYSAIEDNILKGKVSFDESRNALIYSPDNVDASYEMTEVSSMVSEISPVVAFLKYIMSPGSEEKRTAKSVLFIEEPEAHLHPGNQIALIEIFSSLIDKNVKLIMSSHSNYIFNKLNNMVLGKKLNYHVYDPIVLEENSSGSISKHVEMDELGAVDENFVDVSEYLYNEREEIIEKLNMED